MLPSEEMNQNVFPLSPLAPKLLSPPQKIDTEVAECSRQRD